MQLLVPVVTSRLQLPFSLCWSRWAGQGKPQDDAMRCDDGYDMRDEAMARQIARNDGLARERTKRQDIACSVSTLFFPLGQ